MNRSTTLCAKCFVPFCKNTTTKNRDKVFVLVREIIKRKWCEEANVEYKPGKRLFCCEDHINLEEDLENYQRFKLTKGRPILKSSAKLRLGKNLSSCSEGEASILKSDEPSILKSLLLQSVDTYQSQRANVVGCNVKSNIKPTGMSTPTRPTTIDTGTQCQVEMINRSTSTKGLNKRKKTQPLLASSASLSTCGITSSSFFSYTSGTESNITYMQPSDSARKQMNIMQPSDSVRKQMNIMQPSDSARKQMNIMQPSDSARKQMLHFISANPKGYIGLPKQFYWLINHIVINSQTKVTELDIIITLFKIKLNDPVYKICNEFQISRMSFTQHFHTGIQLLANFFQNFVYMPPSLQIKEKLPLAFKIRYSNVILLLNVFEIEIQKPHNPMRQAQTWSQYKNANTVKYLIGSTPNGFVSYISKGYGGRISDKALVEQSELINYLPENSYIMADRGFKEIEALLMVKKIKLMRPPSVYTSNKPKMEQVIQTKLIASLRMHIERVIRRIREFRFLKPHSVVSRKHVSHLDHVMLIACGLINLQNEIIKC